MITCGRCSVSPRSAWAWGSQGGDHRPPERHEGCWLAAVADRHAARQPGVFRIGAGRRSHFRWRVDRSRSGWVMPWARQWLGSGLTSVHQARRGNGRRRSRDPVHRHRACGRVVRRGLSRRLDRAGRADRRRLVLHLVGGLGQLLLTPSSHRWRRCSPPAGSAGRSRAASTARQAWPTPPRGPEHNQHQRSLQPRRASPSCPSREGDAHVLTRPC